MGKKIWKACRGTEASKVYQFMGVSGTVKLKPLAGRGGDLKKKKHRERDSAKGYCQREKNEMLEKKIICKNGEEGTAAFSATCGKDGQGETKEHKCGEAGRRNSPS